MANQTNKFIVSSVAAALVGTAVAPVAGFAAKADFTDVAGHWAEDAINYLVGKNAINGYEDGTFKPNGEITRAEAAKILAETLGLEIDDNDQTNFADAKNHWASKYIAAIQDQKPGVINGYENDTFRPDNKITRQEMAKMIATAYGLELNENAIIDFNDNTSWGAEQVEILASLGIVQGQGEGKFAPEANVTRGETATFVHRSEVEDKRVEVELKEVPFAVENVKAATPEKVTVSFNKETTELDREDIVITDENDDRVFVKAVELAEDGMSATIELYEALEDETSYDFTVQNGEEGFTYAYDFELGEVAEVLTSSVTINPSEDYEIEYTVVTDTGVNVTDITEVTFNATKNVITNDGVIEAGDLQDGESVFVEIVAGDVKSKRIKITANASEATEFSAYTVTAQDQSVGTIEDWTAEDFEVDHNIALGQKGLKLDTLFLDQYGEQAAGTVTFESLTPSVLVVDTNTGALTPRKEGTADVKITNGDVTKVVTIEVVAKAKFDAIEFRNADDEAISNLAMNPAVENSETVKVQLLDQYGENFDPAGEETLTVEVKGDSVEVAEVNADNEVTTDNGAVELTLNHVDGETGTTTITVKNEDGKIVKSLKVSIEEAGEIADYTVEGLKTLDLYAGEDNDTKTTLKLFPVDENGVKTSTQVEAEWTIEEVDGDFEVSSEEATTEFILDTQDDLSDAPAGEYKVTAKVGSLIVFEDTFTIVDTEPAYELTQKDNDVEVTFTSLENAELLAALQGAFEVTQDNESIASTNITEFKFVSDDSSVVDGTDTSATLADGEATLFIETITINDKEVEVDFQLDVKVDGVEAAINMALETVQTADSAAIIAALENLAALSADLDAETINADLAEQYAEAISENTENVKAVQAAVNAVNENVEAVEANVEA